MKMKNTELIFIPFPGLSHLISAVEAAKLLLRRDHRLSITVLIMKLTKANVVDAYTHKISSDPNTPPGLNFINLPPQQETADRNTTAYEYVVSLKDAVREIISDLNKDGSIVGGLVLGMFCTCFMDVAKEFDIPVYIFFSCGGYCLGLTIHLASLKFDRGLDLTKYKNSDEEIIIPCFSNPVPAKVFPSVYIEDLPFCSTILSSFKRLKEVKGIMVNSFYELESFAFESMFSDEKMPKIYPVGPVLHLESDDEKNGGADEIKKWLDNQPENAVVFLCFGSMGSFESPQVKEIAVALEKSGVHFLWSLRKPAQKGVMKFPTEYENFEEVLPEGFLERTKAIGKIIGWAPQARVLAHPSVGGFVSHCGWNSILESVWFGVPVATFPLTAEQQSNAFELVKELKMAEAISIDYRVGFKKDEVPEIVTAEKIEMAIRRLMAVDGDGGVRKKVKEMQRKSRLALDGGGSSYHAQSLFIEDIFDKLGTSRNTQPSYLKIL